MTEKEKSENNPPLVLFLASFFPNRVYPVKGPFIRNFADTLSTEYPLVVLTAEADSNQKGFWAIEKTKISGYYQYTVYYNPTKFNVPLLRSVVNFFSFFIGSVQAYKLITKQHGDVGIHHLHSSLPMGIFALYLKWFRGKPYVFSEQVTIYIYERFKRLNLFQKWLHRSIFKNASSISALTHYHANEISKCGLAHEISVIPNVIDTSLYGCITTDSDPSPVKWVHISTLSPVKGVEDQLRAMALLVSQGQQIEFTIIGGNAERIKELQQLAEKLGISERVYWKGWLERKQFVPIMQSAHMFMLNSEFETFCVVAAEALACGLPVVCPSIGPLKEFIHEKNGVFFDERKPEKIAEAALHCMGKLKDYNKKEIMEEVENNFGPGKVKSLFRHLYSGLLDSGRN
jgi:glycosyltransferase involved in cell wall biosynthesis